MIRRDGLNEVHASVPRPSWSKNRLPKPRPSRFLEVDMKLGMSEGHETGSQRSEIGFDHLRVDVWRSSKLVLRSKVVEI